jgi:hypothetical protein
MSSTTLGLEVYGEEFLNESVETASEKKQELLFSDIQKDFEAAVGLESIAYSMLKADPSDFNALTVKLINFSVKNIKEKASISIESLPFGQTNRVDPATVAAGLNAIRNDKETSFSQVRDNFTHLFTIMAARRSDLEGKISRLEKRLPGIEARLVEKEEISTEPFPIGSKSVFQRLVYDGQIVANASGVSNDVCHFLTEHNHMYKRLIHKLTNWVKDHKDNELRTIHGYRSYALGPAEYICHGAQGTGETFPKYNSTFSNHLTSLLPGSKIFSMCGVTHNVSGADAITAQLNSECKLIDDRRLDESALQRPIAALSSEELAARLSEAKRGLEALRHWSDVAFVEMWKDACFEGLYMSAMIEPTVAKISERLLGDFGLISLKLLEEASKSVGEYAYEVFEALIEFVEFHLER